MEPRLTDSLALLRLAFDSRWPNRSRTSDGWIGDTAHQAEVSGHNPDDTAGVRAEYSDTDTIPEVRAIDVTRDDATFDMHGVIDSILHTPADLTKLKYMIFERTQWSRSNGWKPVAYVGASAHDEHAHFSGDPAHDADTTEWLSVINYGHGKDEDDMGASTPPIEIKEEGITSLCIPPVEQGLADPRPAWLNIANDTQGPQYALRVWGCSDKGWHPLANETGQIVCNSGGRYSYGLTAGVYCISITRQPIGDTPPYAGHLTVCIERGAVK
jgi:hypothetical protein